MTDAAPTAEIRRFLELLFESGEVWEIRAPACRERADSHYTFTCSGYYTDLDRCVHDVAELDRSGIAPAVYFTLNPVTPSLLARSANRIKAKAKSTTADGDIVQRRWLLIDVDPERPAGISSTNTELALACIRAEAIRDSLTSAGWPLPIRVMSGNGHHLLYRIDLPNDDGGLVQRVLNALADHFDDENATIDRGVFNPARISKLPGTMVRKGDDLSGIAGIEDRPHRRAALLDVPEPLEVVPLSALETVAGATRATQTPPVVRPYQPGESTLVCTPAGIRSWLESHGIRVKGERRNGSKTMLLLESCPINPEIVSTGSSDIAVLVGDDGMLSYCNKHNRGQHYTWHDLRRTLDPNWTPLPVEDPGVDLSQFGPLRPAGSVDESPRETPDPRPPETSLPAEPAEPVDDIPDEEPEYRPPLQAEPFPEHLLNVPGLIGRTIEYNLETAHRRQPILALAGAICLQAVLAARKVRDPSDNRTNIYCICIANSGAGKEHARQVNKAILYQTGLDHLEGCEDIASDAGLEAAVEHEPATLFQIDEIGRFLRTIGDPKKNPHLFSVLTVLMKLYSASGGTYRGKAYGDRKRNRVIDQPCVVLYGTSVPSHFYESLTAESLNDGLVSRLLVFETGMAKEEEVEKKPVPAELIEAAGFWGEFKTGGNLRKEHPEPLVVPYTDEAKDVIRDLRAQADNELYRPEYVGQGLWSRVVQKACRLALIYACSAQPQDLCITLEAARWGCELSDYLTRRMLQIGQSWIADSPFDAEQKRVLRMIQNAGGRISRSELLRKTQRITRKYRDEILSNLLEVGLLAMEAAETKGRQRIDYVLQ